MLEGVKYDNSEMLSVLPFGDIVVCLQVINDVGNSGVHVIYFEKNLQN